MTQPLSQTCRECLRTIYLSLKPNARIIMLYYKMLFYGRLYFYTIYYDYSLIQFLNLYIKSKKYWTTYESK